MLFDSFEAYDVQETRRVSRAQGRLEVLTFLLSDKSVKKYKNRFP